MRLAGARSSVRLPYLQSQEFKGLQWLFLLW